MVFTFVSRGKVRSVEYTNDTTFVVQVGKGKGKYTSSYTYQGNFNKAAHHYAGINVGYGYKKRILIGNTVVARCFSS